MLKLPLRHSNANTAIKVINESSGYSHMPIKGPTPIPRELEVAMVIGWAKFPFLVCSDVLE